MERILGKTALFLSYLWEFVLLPLHSARLANLRLSSHRLQHELRLALDLEATAFKQDVARVQRMERDLAAANLRLAASRSAAAGSFQQRLVRMRHHLHQGLGSVKEVA